jgi:hypothetical protein
VFKWRRLQGRNHIVHPKSHLNTFISITINTLSRTKFQPPLD